MTSTLAQGVYQIGIVVPDIHKGMTFFKDKLGVPEFRFIEKPELQDETYLASPLPCAFISPSAGAAIRRSN